MSEQKKNKAAVALGRLGGKKTSERKKASSAANGKRGGRPRTVKPSAHDDGAMDGSTHVR